MCLKFKQPKVDHGVYMMSRMISLNMLLTLICLTCMECINVTINPRLLLCANEVKSMLWYAAKFLTPWKKYLNDVAMLIFSL